MRLMSMNNCCYFIQIIKAQRYTSYIKVTTLSGLTLVALKEAMLRLGAEKAMMSGSGPTVFGLVKVEETACRLKEKLLETFSQDLLLDVACTEEYYG